ncbi:small ribosomal subunit protein uS9m-like [Ornithodoros turicata]|uniref:small ribosomal subunit protein uS9m-like n=1 Tax=Ornithodoros turicata TaxID=34597 RepID=UPI003139CC1C
MRCALTSCIYKSNQSFLGISCTIWLSQVKCCSTEANVVQTTQLPSILQGQKPAPTKAQRISRAMKAYLERAKKYDEFIKREKDEFEIGKRHLANMMGLDVDDMTQADIDRAIEYLMPSGLYEKKARPMMKPPEEVFPREKAAQFDYTGRPFHYLFYTTKPNFYEVLHESVSKMNTLNQFESRMIGKGVKEASAENKVNFEGSEWLSKEEMEHLLVESLKEHQYEYFVKTLDRLASHPYSAREKEFLKKYRKEKLIALIHEEVPPLMYDELGRPYMTAEGRRKTARATITVWGNGTGKVRINGCGIEYFEEMRDREQIMFPLQFTGLLLKVDFEATVTEVENGPMCQAGALRHALARALRSFVSPDEVERMRLAGLINVDRRRRERKKPGQEGARRKFPWRKR